MSQSSSKSNASRKSTASNKSTASSKSPARSKRKRIDILVPCHSYLNEPNKYGGPHPPVFLFLYNEKTKSYDKINITDVPPLDSDEEDGQGEATLKSLEKNKNIHIKFIDDATFDTDVNNYQYNKKEQLIGQTFDYIFPIHCTGTNALQYQLFLKPAGKLLDPLFRISEDYVNTLEPVAAEQLKTNIISARKTFAPYENGQHRIEFHKYIETKEPYIYKEDIVGGYGWYNVYAPSDNSYALPGGSGTRKRSTRKRSTRKRSTRKRSTRKRSTKKGKKSKKSIRHKKRR